MFIGGGLMEKFKILIRHHTGLNVFVEKKQWSQKNGNSMNKEELIYLACPYSHNDPKVREERFHQVNKVASGLMSEGYYILSPISHTHPIALSGKLPLGWEYWEGYDTLLIKSCKCVLVLQLDGWKESKGVQAEIKIAEKLGIPVEYIDLRLQ